MATVNLSAYDPKKVGSAKKDYIDTEWFKTQYRDNKATYYVKHCLRFQY